MSNGHKTAEKNNYKVEFHPAWASRLAVTCDGEDCEIYSSDGEVYHLPNGEGHPKKHKIRLEGGPYGRDVTITIDDPNHAVAGFSLKLYGPGHQPGAGARTGVVETLEGDNDVMTCPPFCGPPPRV